MEIELKLLIAADSVDAFRALPLLSEHCVAAPESQDLFSTYFDTPALHLKQHRSALRVRKAGALWIQTYKGGGSVAAGLHQRHEWECEVAGPRIELDKLLPLVDNPAARTALELPGLTQQLEAIFTTSFLRTAWQLRLPQGTEVEVALDEGVVEAGGSTQPICEIELELKSGDTGELLAFAQALRQAIPLTPSNVSKAQRGFALRGRGLQGADSSL